MARHLIAVDWGTSNARAWLLDGKATPIAQSTSNKGMNRICKSEYNRTLASMVGSWLSDSVSRNIIACGMLGAANGWVEAKYRTVPCEPVLPLQCTSVVTSLENCVVYIIPGIKQYRPTADVMRGEETQIAGFLAGKPQFNGVMCLPGTHTKWVHISAGEIVSFRSFMTGELYDLLSSRSILRHSVASGEHLTEDFLEAASDQLSQPEKLAARLFALRAESLIAGLDAPRAGARLAGYLIGAELAASRPYWLGHRIAIVGAPRLAKLYSQALSLVGQEPIKAEAEQCTILGLAQAHAQSLT